MSDPIQHIDRARPPWRRESITECGQWSKDVASTMSHEDAETLIERLGIRRAALVLCMTCVEMFRCARHGEHPVLRDTHGKGRELLETELAALEMLAHAHADEFFRTLDWLRRNRGRQPAVTGGRK